MGWSKGKGLGVDLNGEQDFVKVSYKLDQKGLGFTDRDDQWTQHEDQFNHLLKSFDENGSKSNSGDDDNVTTTNQQETGTHTSGLSLEQLSKKSRARVHYKKFTRGKDMSRYNEKDLANIFGRRTLDEKPTEENEVIEIEMKTDENNDIKIVPNFGITTIETGISVNDYFKQKLSVLRGDCGNSNEKTIDEKRKKNKKSKQRDEILNDCSEEITDTVLPVEKKKKKRKSEDSLDNQNVEVVEKKKKKKCKEQSETIEVIIDDEIESAAVYPENGTKSKKSKNKDELTTNGHSDIETIILPLEQNKKKKRKCELSEVIAEEHKEEMEVKEKKKKKKDKYKDLPNEETDEIANEEIPLEKKRKRNNKNSLTDTEPTARNEKSSSALEVSKLVESLVYKISTENASQSIASDHIPNDNKNNSQQHIDDNMLQNIFTINTFKLEIFKFLDLDGFHKSTLSNISGYGYGNDLKLNVIETLKDLNRINNFYDEALVQKYGKNVVKTKRKEKYNVNKLKKKNIFKGIM